MCLIHFLQNAYGTSSAADPLPTGWEERQDANGRIYLVNTYFRKLFKNWCTFYIQVGHTMWITSLEQRNGNGLQGTSLNSIHILLKPFVDFKSNVVNRQKYELYIELRIIRIIRHIHVRYHFAKNPFKKQVSVLIVQPEKWMLALQPNQLCSGSHKI